VITKNAEDNLPRCLRSVDGLVDEIIVTDSGSTDETVAIAERAGAFVVPFQWCDDFSAAYNTGLACATGEWILILDADEELAPDSAQLVRSLIRPDDAFAYTVFRRDYYGDEVKDTSQTEMLQTRLIRRRDGVRFVGRIHQQLEPSLSRAAYREGRLVLRSELRIRHYGYMGDSQIRKLDRSIRLLELELEERPDQFYYLVELGRSKIAKGDASGMIPLTRAAEMVADGAQRVGPGTPMVQLLLEQLLTLDTLPAGFPLPHERVESIALHEYADSIPLVLQCARRRFREGDYAASLAHIESVHRLMASDAYDKSCSFDPAVIHGDTTLNQGVCYAHLGQIEEAIACFDSLADHPRLGAGARQNAAALRDLRT
jgi:tetratricopeptide (TPR) repeat protein